MTANNRPSDQGLHTNVSCNKPASRSFGQEQQTHKKSWARGAFSSSFAHMTVTDEATGPIITLTNQNCPAWLLGVVCKGPHFRSIDRQGNLTAGGAYERLGKNARASLGKSIGPDGNFTNIKFPLFHRRHSGEVMQGGDLFVEEEDASSHDAALEHDETCEELSGRIVRQGKYITASELRMIGVPH
eukprot:604211-Hanusia_phi.AAC.2